MSVANVIAIPGKTAVWVNGSVGGAPTFSTSGIRAGGGDTLCQCAATGVAIYLAAAHASGHRQLVESFYILWPSNPATNPVIYTAINANGNMTITLTSAGKLQATGGSQTSALTANVWYHIDVRVDTSGATATLDWWLNGALQSQGTHVQAAADITATRIGINSAQTATLQVMDWVQSYTSADAPLGSHIVKLLSPSVGVHSLGSGAFKKTGAVAIDGADATSHAEINEVPPSASQWVSQTVIDSTHYLEYAFPDDLSVHPPVGVVVCAEFQGNAINTYTMQIRLNDGTGETADLAAAITKNGTTLRELISQQVLAPSGVSWSRALINGAKVRFGYSDDVTPNPQLNALSLVAAYPDIHAQSSSMGM